MSDTSAQSPNSRSKVLISGAASGIGRATAERFAAEGCDICLLDRNAPTLAKVREGLTDGHHLTVDGDYSNPGTAGRAAELITTEWGRLDALINCAGASESHPNVGGRFEDWHRCFRIMTDGAVRLSRASVPLMTEGGRIVHITSIHGRRAERGSGAYSMAKAALDQYCRSLAVELADRGILVNAIAPGFVDTPMSVKDGVNELKTDWFRIHYVEGHHLPLRRAAQPGEIAGVAWFLCGPDAGYITGQVLTVDGGLTITF